MREKLYSKELEVEQLQAELATAVRGNDILRCEVQNALDNLSCVTHNLKDLELQVILYFHLHFGKLYLENGEVLKTVPWLEKCGSKLPSLVDT